MSLPAYPKDALDIPESWARLMGEFWLERFQQPEALMGILRWLEAAREQLDTDLSEAEQSVAVDTMPVVHREWWVPITLVDVQTEKLLKYGDGAVYGGSATDVHGRGQLFAYGVRASPYGSSRTYALPRGVVGLSAILDAPCVPQVCWVAGLDITVDTGMGLVVLPVDPFTDPRFAHLIATISGGRKEITMWAFGCDVDWRLGHTRVGYALGTELPSNSAASRVLRALWKSAVRGGATLDDVYQTLLAVAGMEGPVQQETVVAITEDWGTQVVCTDKSVYRIPKGFTLKVRVGDVVGPGDSLVTNISAHISPRAWYPWGAVARRVPELPQPDPYVAISHVPEPVPVAALPDVALASPEAMKYDALLAGAAVEVEQADNKVIGQEVVALNQLPETPVTPVTPPTEPPAINGLSLATKNPPIMVELATTGVHPAPTTYFSGTKGRRGVTLATTGAAYVWVHPQTGEQIPFYSITKEDAVKRGFERQDISGKSDTYPVEFPDVLMPPPEIPDERDRQHRPIGASLDAHAEAIRTNKFRHTGEGGSPVDIYVERYYRVNTSFDAKGTEGSWGYAGAAVNAGSSVADTGAKMYGYMLYIRAAEGFKYPYTFTVRVTGGAVIFGANSSYGVERDVPWDRPPRVASTSRKSSTEWEITVYGDDTVGVWLDVASYGAEVDIASAPAVTPVTNIAYQTEYTGGAAVTNEVGKQMAALVLPGGVAEAGAETRRLYEQQAAGLLPAPVAVRTGAPRVMVIASHPNESTTLLVDAIHAATGYAVDLFYAWELRRGIAVNTLRVSGGGAIHSFNDAVNAVTSGVRVTRFVPGAGNTSRAVHEDCSYDLVVWDSAGGLADIQDIEQEVYGGGLMPGDAVARVSTASSVYAWRVADPALTRYTELLNAAKLEYDAALHAAEVAVAAAGSAPASDPKTQAAATARLVAQQKLAAVRKLERELALDARMWGLHGGVIRVLRAANEGGRGVMVTGGTVSRDMDILPLSEQETLTTILGIELNTSNALESGQAALTAADVVPTGMKPGLLFGFGLPMEAAVRAAEATPVLKLVTGGDVVTAKDGLGRAVLCNYRLLNSPPDFLPSVPPAAEAGNALPRVASVTVTRVDENGTPVVTELHGSTEFYCAQPWTAASIIQEYIKYADAAQAVGEYVITGAAPDEEIELPAPATVALRKAGYEETTITRARAAELYRELTARAGIAGYNAVMKPDSELRSAGKGASSHVNVRLTDVVPHDMALRYTLKMYSSEYATVPAMTVMYDVAEPREVRVDPNSLFFDHGERGPATVKMHSLCGCPGIGMAWRKLYDNNVDTNGSYWQLYPRVVIELSLVSRGRMAGVVRNGEVVVTTDWLASTDEVKLCRIQLGNGGTGVFDDGYAPIVEHQIGTWDTLDSRKREAAFPGKLMVTAGSVSGLASSDVVYYSGALDYEMTKGTLQPDAGVADTGDVYMVNEPVHAIAGEVRSFNVHAVGVQLTMAGGATRQFNTLVMSRSTTAVLASNLGSSPRGVVIASSRVTAATWRTVDKGGDDLGYRLVGEEAGSYAYLKLHPDRELQSGTATVVGQAWNTEGVDFTETSDAAAAAPGRVVFEITCYLTAGFYVRKEFPWPTPCASECAPFGDVVQDRHPAGTLLGTVIQLPAFSHQTQRGFPGWTHQPPQVFPEAVETLYNPAASSEDYKHLLTVAASEFIVPRRFWNFTVGRTRVDRFYAVVYTGVSHFTAGTYVFHVRNESGVRMFIGNKDEPRVDTQGTNLMTIDDAVEHEEHEVEKPVVIPEDGMYPIRLEFFQGRWGRVALGISVTPEGGERRIWRPELEPGYVALGSIYAADGHSSQAEQPEAIGTRACILGVNKSDALLLLSNELRASAAGYYLVGHKPNGTQVLSRKVSGAAAVGSGSGADFSGTAVALTRCPGSDYLTKVQLVVNLIDGGTALGDAYYLPENEHEDRDMQRAALPDATGAVLPGGIRGRYIVVAAPAVDENKPYHFYEDDYADSPEGHWVAVEYQLVTGAVTLVLTYAGRYRTRVSLSAEHTNRVVVYQKQRVRNTPTVHYLQAYGNGRLELRAAAAQAPGDLTEAAGFLPGATAEMAVLSPQSAAGLDFQTKIGAVMVEDDYTSPNEMRSMVLYQ